LKEEIVEKNIRTDELAGSGGELLGRGCYHFSFSSVL
jgi:hypothetical protein